MLNKTVFKQSSKNIKLFLTSLLIAHININKTKVQIQKIKTLVIKITK